MTMDVGCGEAAVLQQAIAGLLAFRTGEAALPILKRCVLELLMVDASASADNGRAHDAAPLPTVQDTSAAPLIKSSPPHVRTALDDRRRRARRKAEPDPAWNELRAKVRSAMTARGINWTALGEAIGRTALVMRNAVSRTTPPSGPIIAALRSWLDAAEASEVAASGAMFRPERGNGEAREAATP